MGGDPLWLFSYGTLRRADVQRALFGRELVEAPDALTGFALHQIQLADPDGGGFLTYPILRRAAEPAPDIAGAALAILPEDLAAADAYEGEAYRRVSVTLASGRTAFVYVAAGEAA
jgi:gamma-glutamylcyclotransferase (GGCT)/AIG2-like uncharacterized protein YtfP